MTVSENGNRAILDLIWHHPLADVRVRFLGLPTHDCLYCEIALEPKQEIKSVQVMMRCYPSFFTADYVGPEQDEHRAGARRIQTPATLVLQDQPARVPAKDNWWAVYYDKVFDVAEGEGDGPCAMMLLPEAATEINFKPGSYAVDTSIAYPATIRRLRLAFWDFQGSTNAAALNRLRRDAVSIRKELSGLDFMPAAVRGQNLAEMRASVERVLKSETTRACLGNRLAQVQAWLNESAPAASPKAGPPSIEAEEKLVQCYAKYNDIIWDVKLAELLGGP